MTRRMAAAVTSVLGVVAGLLIAAVPFAAGGRTGGRWSTGTVLDVATGGAVVLAGLVGVGTAVAGLVGELRRRGLIGPEAEHGELGPGWSGFLRPHETEPRAVPGTAPGMTADTALGTTHGTAAERRPAMTPGTAPGMPAETAAPAAGGAAAEARPWVAQPPPPAGEGAAAGHPPFGPTGGGVVPEVRP